MSFLEILQDARDARLAPGAGTWRGPFDPEELLPAIRAQAARKSADTVLVSFEPHAFQQEPRILRGTTFRCGDHPLPPELGEPLK